MVRVATELHKESDVNWEAQEWKLLKHPHFNRISYKKIGEKRKKNRGEKKLRRRGVIPKSIRG